MKQVKPLGSTIKQRRHALNLTQRELAERIGIKASYVAYLEKEQRRPSLTVLARLADALDLDRNQLFLLTHPEAQPLMPVGKGAAHSEDPAMSWRRFVNNRALQARYHITSREIQALKHLSLLGYVLTEREFLAILSLVRQPDGG